MRACSGRERERGEAWVAVVVVEGVGVRDDFKVKSFPLLNQKMTGRSLRSPICATRRSRAPFRGG